MITVSKPAPRAARSAPLPAWPDAWYVVARSVDLKAGCIVDGRIADRAFVLYRSASGEPVALDAHCPHMGTHLRNGQVVGDRLRCPLHHWTIGRDAVLQGEGACQKFRSRTWPVAERFGLVFVFAGNAPPPPPFAAASEGYAWATAKPVVLRADWRALVVNGFDTLHMRAVHQRAVLSPPQVSLTSEGGARMSYETRVLPGGGLSSWLLRLLSSGTLRISQTCHGPALLVESSVGRFRSRAVFGMTARGDKTDVYMAFGAPAGGLNRLHLWLARALYTAFLRKDCAVIEDMRLTVDGVADPGVRGIAGYLRSLPELGRDDPAD